MPISLNSNRPPVTSSAPPTGSKSGKSGSTCSQTRPTITSGSTSIRFEPRTGRSAALAHGLLTLSLLPRFMHELYSVEGVKMAINYGFNKVRFITPVAVGAKIRASARVEQVTRVGDAVQAMLITTIDIDGATKPAAVVESIVRYVG